MSRSLMKKAVAFFLSFGLIASTAFISPASAEETPSFPVEDIYFNNYLDFYNGIDKTTGNKISNSLLLIKNFDTYIQNQSYTCGNVASMMVENYYNGSGLSEGKVTALETAMGTTADFGTGTESIKAYFDNLGWYTLTNYGKYDEEKAGVDKTNEYYTWPIDCDTYVYEPLKFLKDNVAAGMPTLVECLDWGGHWLVVIGYDDMGTSDFNSKDDIRDDVIIMADPGDKTDHNWNGYYIFPAARFLYEWYDDYCLIYSNNAYERWNTDLYDTVYLWHPFVLTCPPVLAKTDQPLEEKTLNNSVVELSLMGVEFNDSLLAQDGFSLVNAPTGLSISEVRYIDKTNAVVTLTFTGSDFDAEKNMFVKVAGVELSSGKEAVSNVLSISAQIESRHGGSGGRTSSPVAAAPSQPEPKVSEIGGVKTSTVELSSDFILGQLNANSRVITVEVKNGSDRVVGQIGGALLKDLADKSAGVRIKTDHAEYVLPAGQMDLNGICSQFGPGVSPQDVNFSISIVKPEREIVDMIRDSSEGNGYTIVAAPVQFDITCTYQGREVTVDKFNGFVDRYIAIPDGIGPNQVTSAVVLQADGTLRPVPMKIVEIDGKKFAKISSLTNSTYALISNRIQFSDTAGHWAKDAVNDLSSRLIVNGVGGNLFSPNKAITRAEFAAIMVKALGIEPKGSADFTDVKAKDWFKGYVDAAFSKGLISGYSDGSFKPHQNITREEAMTILLRAMKVTGIDPELSAPEVSDQLKAFSDNGSISSWAQTAVASCVKKSIASGRDESLMAPKNNITRAEICVMIQRMLQKSDLI